MNLSTEPKRKWPISSDFFLVLFVDYGSAVKEACTKETNTKCQCRGEFVPAESDSSTCKCEIGFGLKSEGMKKDHTTLRSSY